MICKYKIIRFYENNWKNLNRDYVQLKQEAEKKAIKKLHSKYPDWEKESSTLPADQREKILLENYYLAVNTIIRKGLEEKHPSLIFSDFLTNSSPPSSLDFTDYFELLLNTYGSRGWELDKIRTFRNTEHNGYFIFCKKT